MTRLFLAAGVAALAIATPLAAKPGGGHGNGGGGGAPAEQGGGGGGHGHGGGGGAPAFNAGGGGGHGHGGGGGGFAPMFSSGGGGRGHGGGGAGYASTFAGSGGHGHGHGGGFAAPQMRAERQQFRGFAREQSRGFERPQARQQSRGLERQQAHRQSRGLERQQARQQSRGLERQQARQQARVLERQQTGGFERQQVRMNERQQLRGDGMKAQRQAFSGQQFNGQVVAQAFGGAKLNGNASKVANQQFVQQNWDPNRYAALSYGNNVRVLPVTQAEQFVGVPVATVAGIAALSPLPTTIQYLYPDTPDYYYRFGDGYLYQVDRTDNLIAALIPLLAGGYLPGQYLPASYMASYVPSYYGFDSFYPDYGYGNLCNRYYEGVIYQVDCYTGFVENVIPMYAGGYGVGQLLPSAYTYYNVPTQYRSLYYNTPDYGYWYAPGAIYQYDQRSSLITSVAALMSPGFTIGQPLPLGYSVYNVPYDYRATYYDTPTAWYRYSNGYIYQVDPATQIVSAIVASLLT
jgi:hypothetical protein